MIANLMVVLASGLAFLILVLSGVVHDAAGAAVVVAVMTAAGVAVLRYAP